jgi:hypothetical protein
MSPTIAALVQALEATFASETRLDLRKSTSCSTELWLINDVEEEICLGKIWFDNDGINAIHIDGMPWECDMANQLNGLIQALNRMERNPLSGACWSIELAVRSHGDQTHLQLLERVMNGHLKLVEKPVGCFVESELGWLSICPTTHQH